MRDAGNKEMFNLPSQQQQYAFMYKTVKNS